jgi:thiosulfate dehydrogenase
VNHINKPTRTIWLASLACCVIAAGSARADENGDERSEIWSTARGGQLYDKWSAVLGSPVPKETHPSYPASGKQSGAGTWRCKECHGWDYRGNEGAYAKGSHHTGIKGISGMASQPPEQIAAILRSSSHGYTEAMIPQAELMKLALFVSKGQLDMDPWIDRSTKRSRGSAKDGAAAYQTICAVCHGFDGKALNFKTAEKPEYIGTIANDNPWEFLHKARFGQPGIPMISLITLPMEDIADILAYAQTLPQK